MMLVYPLCTNPACKATVSPQEASTYHGRCEDCFAWDGKNLSHSNNPHALNAISSPRDSRVVRKGTGD